MLSTVAGLTPLQPGVARLFRHLEPPLPRRCHPPSLTGYSMQPDIGTLVPPFGLVQAAAQRPTPGALYNVVVLTVRNGTSQTFGAGSGFTVQVSGGSGAQPFPQGTAQWKPGSVLVFYTLTQSQSPFPPNFIFKLKGATFDQPTSIFYGIQYNPSNFAQDLSTLVSTRLVGSRYRLV